MAIRLMRATEVPETPRDRVYRASRLRAMMFVIFCLGGCAALVFFRWPKPRLSYYISAVVILLLVAMRRFVTARFHPANWLVRTGDEGLFIHFRSYLNEHLSSEDPTVAFIPFGDIRSARLVRERLKTRNLNDSVETQYIRSVEFELSADPAPLGAAIAAECASPAVKEKRWYGSSSILYRDYPVLMQSPPFVRVQWQVVPGAASFLDAIRQRVPIADPIVVTEDFANLQALPREQQDDRLRQLDQRGQTNSAVYLARRLYSLDLTSAVHYVQTLRGGPQ